MAYTKKTNNTVTTDTENINTTIETARTYDQEDLIPCRSMVSGLLYIRGNRSKIPYRWADYGDVVEIEYRDLIYMVRTHNNKYIYSPKLIIEDEEFIAQNPKLKEFYDSLYTESDLYEIISMPVNQMKPIVEKLPIGCKNALKGIASTMIDEGRLDSVNKIKALDEIFGTQMLLTLIQD